MPSPMACHCAFQFPLASFSPGGVFHGYAAEMRAEDAKAVDPAAEAWV